MNKPPGRERGPVLGAARRRRQLRRRDLAGVPAHPVDDVYVGLFFYELDQAANLLRFFREFIKDADEAYGAFPAFQIAPPLPFVPEDRHGDTFCVAVVHWSGPLEQGEK